MIKRFILMMFLVASSLVASEVNWAKDYNAGIEKAKKQNKPVLFIVSRDTCKYCIILDNTTLSDKKVVERLNKNFISIRSWINKGDYIPRMILQNTPGLPGIWFLFPDGKPIFQPLLGMVKKDKFLQALDIVQDEFKKQKKDKK